MSTTKELAQTYRAEILKKHEAGQKADESLRASILMKLDLCRQTGLLISDAYGDLRGEQFDQATDFLSKDAIRSYLKFARENPEPITELENAIRAIHTACQSTGALSFPDGHGIQQRHRPNFFSFAEGLIQNLSAAWAKYVRSTPLKSWRTEMLESFVATLTPISRILDLVHRELRHR